MSRHSRRHNTPELAARKSQKLRAEGARRAPERARRQFVPSTMEFPDEFRVEEPQKVYLRRNGEPADIETGLPPNSNFNVRKTDLLPALHDYFKQPSRNVMLCVRRHERRAVLFALHRTSKGARQKDRRWSQDSRVRCV